MAKQNSSGLDINNTINSDPGRGSGMGHNVYC